MGPGDDLAGKDDLHALRTGIRRVQNAVLQVCLGVGDLKADGLLGAGQYDGFFRVLDHIGQDRRGVRHGVRSVRDDETVVIFVRLADRADDRQPVFCLHIRAVDVKQLLDIDRDLLADLRKLLPQLGAAQPRHQSVRRLHGRDGSAGGQKQDLLFYLTHFIGHDISMISSTA